MAYVRKTDNAKRVYQSQWDIESGVCPYGHPITSCYTTRVQEGKKVHVCKIKVRERPAYVQKYGESSRVLRTKAKHSTVTGLPVQLNRWTGRTDISGSGQSDTEKLILVCGHLVHYLKETISRDHFSPLFCARCDDWKLIHQKGNHQEGQPALVVYPLETVESRK